MPQACSSALNGPIPHDSTHQGAVTRTGTASGSMPGLTGSRSQPSKNRVARPEGCEILDAVPDGTLILLGDTAECAITHVVAGMSPSQPIEVLAQMKIAYVVFMGLIISKIIPFDILTRMLEANRSPIPPPHIRSHLPAARQPSPTPFTQQPLVQDRHIGKGDNMQELYNILNSTEINTPQAASNSQNDDDETDGPIDLHQESSRKRDRTDIGKGNAVPLSVSNTGVLPE
ncbi:hypothetical protein B0H13DRAFT_1850644 [Mycena leptocephala]|nr:hypothetical protein B0H13DRAFT_1850644 [Mycena leptocephala]